MTARIPTKQTGECTDACVICRDPAIQGVDGATYRVQCHGTVCKKCPSVFRDLGFARFLANKNELDALCQYSELPDCAMKLYRSWQSAPVFHLRQEFDNTPVYHEHLRKQIKDTEENLVKLEGKLAGQPIGVRCAPYHVLEPGGSGERLSYCFVCHDGFLDKPVFAMHCQECDRNICEKCYPLVGDVRFAMFLVQEDEASLAVYKYNPEFIRRTPDGDKYAKRVYELHQEFNGTAEHRKILEAKIVDTGKCIAELKHTLAYAEALWNLSEMCSIPRAGARRV